MKRTLVSKFAGRCTTCGSRFPAGTLVDWERGVGAVHAKVAECQAAAVVVATHVPPVVPVAAAAIVAFLSRARSQFAKARFLAPGGGQLRLSIAGPMSKVPGAVQVVHDDTWLGRIRPDGLAEGEKLLARPEVLDALAAIAADPAEAARAYGALIGRCSFCGLELTDEGSVEVGYGPTCAKKYGLPHTAKGARKLVAA